MCVWDKNWFGKKSFLGEVRLPLSALDLTNSTNHWYSFEDKVHMTNYQYSKFSSNNEENCVFLDEDDTVAYIKDYIMLEPG